MNSLHLFELALEGVCERRRQHRDPVLATLAVTHEHLVARKIDILHPQAQALGDSCAYTAQERKRAPRITPLYSSEGEFGQNSDNERLSRGSDAR